MRSACLLSVVACMATCAHAGLASLYTTDFTFKNDIGGQGTTLGAKEMTASPETNCVYDPAGIRSVAINVKLDFGNAIYCILSYDTEGCKSETIRQSAEWDSQHMSGKFHDLPEGVVAAKVAEVCRFHL